MLTMKGNIHVWCLDFMTSLRLLFVGMHSCYWTCFVCFVLRNSTVKDKRSFKRVETSDYLIDKCKYCALILRCIHICKTVS